MEIIKEALGQNRGTGTQIQRGRGAKWLPRVSAKFNRATLAAIALIVAAVAATPSNVAAQGEDPKTDATVVDTAKEKSKADEIPPEKKALLESYASTIKENGDAESVATAIFSSARIYYNYKHMDKATQGFNEVIAKFPTHDLAVHAATLLLNISVSAGDLEATHALAMRLGANHDLMAQPELQAQVHKLMEVTSFKLCSQAHEAGESRKSALCYLDLRNAFPKAKWADQASWNAAIEFEQLGEVGKALQVLELLVTAYPQSSLVSSALFGIANAYQRIADYEEAAAHYERLVERFPKDRAAKEAVLNAATFRAALGQPDRAVANFKLFLKLFSKDKKMCAKIVFLMAKTHEKEGRKKEALAAYTLYLKKYARVGGMDRQLVAQMKIAMAQWDSKRDRKKAALGFGRTLKLYETMPARMRFELTMGADAVAHARFMLAETKRLEVDKIKLPSSPNQKALKKKLSAKLNGLQEVNGLYSKVIGVKSGPWTLASLYQMGNLYQRFARDLRDSPAPKTLNKSQIEIYKQALDDQVLGIEERAIGAYEMCLEAGTRTGLFSAYSEKCERALVELRPRKYASLSELYPPATSNRPGFLHFDFVLTRTAAESDDPPKQP